MGDVADMMVDGTLCTGCGVYMGEGHGVPRTCRECRRVARFDAMIESPQTKCWLCGKKLTATGQAVGAHYRAKHPRSAAC